VVPDEVSPPKSKGLWMGVYESALPFGLGIGSVIGRLLAAWIDWRGALLGIALLSLPVALAPLMFRSKLYASGHDANDGGTFLSIADPRSFSGLGDRSRLRVFWDDLRLFYSHKVARILTLACVFYLGVFNAESYWIARGMEAMFNAKGIDLWYGLICMFSGVVGTILGGVVLDRIGSSIRNAFCVSSIPLLGSGLFLIPVFLRVQNFYVFVVAYAIGLISKVTTMVFSNFLFVREPKRF